jgi:hypothetical protein
MAAFFTNRSHDREPKQAPRSKVNTHCAPLDALSRAKLMAATSSLRLQSS